MKVYILIGYYVGSGSETVAVYSTKEKAEQAKLLKPKSSDDTNFEFLDIQEYDVL